MLLSMLDRQSVQLVDKVDNWQSAIRLAAQPLVSKGFATEGYVEAMIASVIEFGPYIVIDEGLALPHARPEEGGIKPGLALLVVKEGVQLMGNNIFVFAALAAADNDSHIGALSELAEAVWAGATAKRLSSFQSVEEILEFISSISK